MKTIIALFLTVVTGSALAAEGAQTARTGVPLDVAKTISITDTSFACGIVPVEWVYEDSKGERHTATYLVQGGGCMGG
ncbi:DUF2790 domain-containing protein [Pseudomonas chlororaphis]|uniref:DUF2790 domain-containing protein n=1 Tax=Pseudomonas chlororaphis TaxID=587753 RepID=UPI000F5742FD|nr:DUF2790 domain-containing protein [Pseudomonas chlororaphis]QHC91367.1 hypothetical protein PchlR47_24735 [Pseudomonas chlororaphis]WDG71528.1 DUF2790 domain-containing protein [Pseudomonas chlororaphis]WDH30688.1 DUF2790 domain-containing protein [Pseudomonas chlororaphis]WDH70053.1 DUF2790 domain-containing protein [Pseudomonas chlororaphis]